MVFVSGKFSLFCSSQTTFAAGPNKNFEHLFHFMCTLLTVCGYATPGLYWGRDTLEKLQQIQVMKAGQHSTERTVMKGLSPQLQKVGFTSFKYIHMRGILSSPKKRLETLGAL